MSEHSQKIKRRQHPGARRGRARATPKGRQVDPAARDAIRALLKNQPRQRDLLIEYLHLIQDTHGALSAAHLAALAEEMRLPMSEIYEVATFYAHFDVVVDGDAPPPITIRVCDSLSCELEGAQALLGALAEAADPERVRVVRAPCMGRCDAAPVAEVGHHHVDHASVETVMAAANAELRAAGADRIVSRPSFEPERVGAQRIAGRQRVFCGQMLAQFDAVERECGALLEAKLPLPAYDQCIKASHIFNLLDARGVISVTERAGYIGRVRALARGSCEAWIESRK